MGSENTRGYKGALQGVGEYKGILGCFTGGWIVQGDTRERYRGSESTKGYQGALQGIGECKGIQGSVTGGWRVQRDTRERYRGSESTRGYQGRYRGSENIKLKSVQLMNLKIVYIFTFLLIILAKICFETVNIRKVTTQTGIVLIIVYYTINGSKYNW